MPTLCYLLPVRNGMLSIESSTIAALGRLAFGLTTDSKMGHRGEGFGLLCLPVGFTLLLFPVGLFVGTNPFQ